MKQYNELFPETISMIDRLKYTFVYCASKGVVICAEKNIPKPLDKSLRLCDTNFGIFARMRLKL